MSVSLWGWRDYDLDMFYFASLLLSMLVAAPVAGAELPPEILMDRLLLRAQGHIEAGSPADALQVMDQALALKDEYGIELPARFHFDYGRAALAAGQPESAIDHLNRYLIAAGRQGEQYRSALVLLESAEGALREQQAERDRIEAEQRRVQTRLRTNEAQAQRQIEVSRIPLPRDPLSSGGHAPELVPIAEGHFEYSHSGYSKDVRILSFNQPFAMSRYEVAVAEFGQFVNATGYKTEAEREPKHGCQLHRVGSLSAKVSDLRNPRNSMRWNRPGFDQSEEHPVVCVSIRDAMAYADWLSRETGHRYRLPSAAEWEYALRAGSKISFLLDRDIDRDVRRLLISGEIVERDGAGWSVGLSYDCNVGNLYDLDAHDEFNRADCRDGYVYSAPVGSFPPNAVGLHDMAGNIAELAMTCRISYSEHQTAPSPNPDLEHPDRCGIYTHINGVGFASGGHSLRQRAVYDGDAFYGGGYYEKSSRIDIGIRLVRELDPAELRLVEAD